MILRREKRRDKKNEVAATKSVTKNIYTTAATS